MSQDFAIEEQNGFREAAQSLKSYRRAELLAEQNGENLVESLYVDALPAQHILSTVLRGNTTFLIGRKGTGKSTIFQRAQSEIRKSTELVSAYVDIKTVYESSQTDPNIISKLDLIGTGLPAPKLQELLLHRAFLNDVVKELKNQLHQRLKVSFWQRLRNQFSGSFDTLFADLDKLLDDSNKLDLVEVSALIAKKSKTSNHLKVKEDIGGGAKATIGSSPEFSIDAHASNVSENDDSSEEEFSQIFLRIFNIKDFISKLRTLLHGFGIRTLYVFIDDFSELPETAMKIVVDTLLAPLNNWSDELIKFKIAAYPGRIYFGQIDKTKVDEIFLDLYKLYGTDDASGMETKAIEFTRRLVLTRLNHYCGENSTLAKELDNDEIWKHLFYATSGNPRNLGYVLYFVYEANIIYQKKVGIRAVQDAARKYYEDKIESYFAISRFLHESFDERSSIFSLQELLEEIVNKARGLRTHQTLSSLSGRPPTSHFHVATTLEGLLSTLELNFFITKYHEMKDRDGTAITVFALNYGMCQKHTIAFGKPEGSRDDRFRQYYAERVFDYSGLLRAFLELHQEIVCANCATKHKFEMLSAIRAFGMLCPNCRNGKCEVINLSRKYEAVLRDVNTNLLLPKYELGILQTLKVEGRSMIASEIAAELDCSGQMVGRRAKYLDERGLVTREQTVDGSARIYQLTEIARAAYFAENVLHPLDIGID